MRRLSRRQFLGRCMTVLAVIQLVVVTTDVVMRRLTPVSSHPRP